MANPQEGEPEGQPQAEDTGFHPEPPMVQPPESPSGPEPEQHDEVPDGGKCSVCGWEWGNPNPHPVAIMPENVHDPVEGTVAPPEPPPPPEPDPNACPAIPMQGKCPKCGWSMDDPDIAVRSKAHPTY